MRDQASRYIAMILSLLLVAAVPVQAETVSFSDVTVVGDLQSGGQDLRLRTVSGTSETSTETGSPSSTDPAAPSSLISTVTSPQEGPVVETIEQGDITGTICDCGEITIPGAGMPWWPFLAGVPAVCLTGICKPDSSTRCIPGTGNPNCPDTPIPEPASLLLLGTGLAALGAAARRRFRRQAEAANQPAIATEV